MKILIERYLLLNEICGDKAHRKKRRQWITGRFLFLTFGLPHGGRRKAKQAKAEKTQRQPNGAFGKSKDKARGGNEEDVPGTASIQS
ncbi:MAG: hypothetical protein PHX26_00190 [Proteiniphilum sp.]|nr:hypothetical protein [Proteiniphilum sp.]